MVKRRICIVFEEVDERPDGSPLQDGDAGQKFNVFLEGHDRDRIKRLPVEEWSAAEFWAMKSFSIVGEIMQATTGGQRFDLGDPAKRGRG